MAGVEESAFTGGALDSFHEYYDRVRGHVREQVTRANLSDHLFGHELRVLDVGGGEGRDAVWLAKQGHSVHLVDPSSEMVLRAKNRAEQANVADLVRAESGDPAKLVRKESEPYDLVLSHGVMMYLDDPVKHLRLLHDYVAGDGIVSILTKGKVGFLQRLYNDNKLTEMLQLEKTDHMVNSLERNVLAVDEESMSRLLGRAALRIEDWFGVRIISDSDQRKIDRVRNGRLEAIVELETRLSREPSVRGVGQMLHFICERED